MLGYKDMNNALMLLDLLAAATPKGGEMRRQARAAGWNAYKAGIKSTIEILRIKNRFMQPSPTGWADCMINFCFRNTKSKHICEMQIVHDNMMLVRSKMGGHSEYEQLRSASELLEVTGHAGEIEEIDRNDPPQWSSNTKMIVDAALVDNIIYCARTGVLSAEALAPARVPENDLTDVKLTQISEALCAADPPPETLKAVETIVRQCVDRELTGFPPASSDIQCLRHQVRTLQRQVQKLIAAETSAKIDEDRIDSSLL